MLYQSSFSNQKVKASQAIINSMDEAGSLYYPQTIPQVNLNHFKNKSYIQQAFLILKEYFNEFSDEDIQEALNKTYNETNFNTNEISQLNIINQQYGYLELFHGQTQAFKDMALSLYPHLVALALKANNEQSHIHILTATSGDTGKAALEAIKDLKQISITVLYPSNGVSLIQEAQMNTTTGHNVDVVSIKGNFDDAQSLVKDLFNDQELRKELDQKQIKLMSANSINIARLIPQIIYYFNAYTRLVANNNIQWNETINISVPTGNFGNILSAIIAKRMGLPIAQLICATNVNDVLAEFIKTGVYDIRYKELHPSIAPSMDILISSNLERYLALTYTKEEVQTMLLDLKEKHYFSLNKQQLTLLQQDLKCASFNDEAILEGIKQAYEEDQYYVDPHTSCAYLAMKEHLNDHFTLVVATASIFKFPNTILKAFNLESKDLLNDLSKISKQPIPNALQELKNKPIRFKRCLSLQEVKPYLLTKLLGSNYE
ncbi:MAG: threonine synthase [Bacilli bacterium]